MINGVKKLICKSTIVIIITSFLLHSQEILYKYLLAKDVFIQFPSDFLDDIVFFLFRLLHIVNYKSVK